VARAAAARSRYAALDGRDPARVPGEELAALRALR